MQVKEISDQTIWQDFINKCSNVSFLQSWQWGEFAIKQGRRIFRLGLYQNDSLVGINLLIEITSKRGNYLESHAGPIFLSSDPEYFKALHQEMIAIGKREKVHFIRIRPREIYSDEELMTYLNQGYIKAPMYFQAEYTLLLDLTKTEEALMQGLRKQTRYYVKKSKNNSINIRFSKDKNDLDLFFRTYQETVKRQQFIPYSKEFFINEFDSFYPDNIELVFAEVNGTVIATALLIYFDETVYYHHGASVKTEPDLYAPYLLQWEIIKHIKSLGMKTYDFFGIAPTDDEKHARSGLTIFKRGFGGQRVRYMQTLDYPIHWRYWPMYWYVKFERIKRNL